MGREVDSRPRRRDDARIPSVSIAGWTGSIVEAGAGDAPSLIVEWDADSMAKMPAEYQQHCESQGLYSGMACLQFADVDIPE